MSSIFSKEVLRVDEFVAYRFIVVPQAVTTPVYLCIDKKRFQHYKGNMQDGKDQRSSEVVQ
ncbi:hypothetical protein TPER_HE00498 [Candidatus Hoaglandella endobia]|uniref:Uncharacterized protein n=1 Tax=Candidatus Hoaglandella endobia TaxID=1778263 RepID=A0A143WUU6_9ENTR|nr:hypothetical protein TPER_HE00498 [Candidatus Hoaglandella endobia]